MVKGRVDSVTISCAPGLELGRQVGNVGYVAQLGEDPGEGGGRKGMRCVVG